MRREVLDDARYYTARERLIGFLADQASPSEDVAPEEDATVANRLEALKPASL
jgi:hypothetical protein